MRIIEEYRYADNLKSFIVWEMTVEQYERLARDTQGVLMEILKEFNSEVPELTTDEMEAWSVHMMSVVARWKLGTAKGTKYAINDPMKDFHISIWFIMHHLHQSYSDILRMPARLFLDLLDDLPIIVGQKEYDPQRKSERIDGEAIRELKGSL